MHGALQVNHASVGIEAPRAKVAFLIALCDGEDDGVPCIDGHRADAEDLCGHQEARLEVEMVQGDVRGRVLALGEVMAGGPFAFPAGAGGSVSREEVEGYSHTMIIRSTKQSQP